MTIIGNICGTCPDVAFVNQVTVAGNAPSIAAATPPSTGSDPSLFPQIVIHQYDDIARVFSSNDGVAWAHYDVDSNGFAVATNVAALPTDPLNQDYYVLTNRMIYNNVDAAYYTADFPGATNYVDLGSPLIHPTADFDISFEVKFDIVDVQEFLFSQYTSGVDGRLAIQQISPSNTILLFVDGSTDVAIYSTSTVAAGIWYTIRATRNGDTFNLYINDQLEGSQTELNISVQQLENTLLGTNYASFDDFNGQIRNVSITSNNNTTKYLTEDIDLPGASLTNVTSSLVSATKLVPTRVSYCDVDGEWANMTEMVDGQVLHHRDRSTAFVYDNASESWASHVLSNSASSKYQPKVDTPRVMTLFDERVSGSNSRIVNGKAVVVDASRNGTPGPIREKYGLDLDGSTEYATGYDLAGEGYVEFDVSCWVKIPAPPASGTDGIIGQFFPGASQRSWLLYVDSDGHLLALQSDDGTTNTAVAEYEADICDNQWHHIVAQYGGSVPLVYVDGVQVATTDTGSMSGSIYSASTIPIEIGRYQLSNLTCLACSIDDVRIYDSALTDAQIADLAALKPGSTRGVNVGVEPLVWYDFEDPISSPLIRNKGSLGTQADATITGTPANVRDVAGWYSYANDTGYTSSFTTDGVDDYIDTQLTLNGETNFTVWRRARYLSTSGSDHDGFYNSLVPFSTLRLGRGNANETIYAEHTSAGTLYNPNKIIPDGATHTLAFTGALAGNYTVWQDGVKLEDAAVNGAYVGFSNARNYLIGASTGASIENYSNCEYYEYLIASKVLSDRELEWLDTGGLAGDPIDFEGDPDVLLYYDFKTPNDTVVKNLADISLPGLITGGEWSYVGRDPNNPNYDLTNRELQYKGARPRDPIVSTPVASFNGSSERVTTNSSANLMPQGDTTLSARFKTASVGGATLYIAGQYDFSTNNRSLQIGLNSSGQIQGFLSIDGISGGGSSWSLTSGGVFTDDEWHEAVVTVTAGTFKLYIDGALQGATTDAAITYPYNTDVAFAVGAKSGAADRYFIGDIQDVKLGNAFIQQGQDPSDWTPDILHWPLIEGSGAAVYDVTGNGNHGTIPVGVWDGDTTDRSDFLTKNGYAIGTWYDGTNDYFSRPNLTGGFNRFCISFWLQIDSLAAGTSSVAAEWNTAGTRVWYLNISTAGLMSFGVSDDGTNSSAASTSSGAFTAGELCHVSITYDAGSIAIEKNGVSVASTTIADTSAFAGSAQFTIGASQSGTKLTGSLSQFVVHKDPTVVWDTATKAAIRAAGKTEDIAAIVSDLSGTAWYFPNANQNETLQNILPLTTNGAPEQRIIPAGAGVPVQYNKLAPGQSLDLSCGAPNAPFAVSLNATAVSDLTYVQGDNIEADVIFVNSQPTGDDKIQIFESALTGNEREALRDDVA